MALDTNILIYAAKPGGEKLRDWVQHPGVIISIISRIEALGSPKITPEEKAALEELFAFLPEISVTDAIARRAIAFRQERRVTVADAIIAATALVYGVPVVSRNSDDFKGLSGLRVSQNAAAFIFCPN